MTTLTQPLPCIVCNFQPKQAFGEHADEQSWWYPYKATMFDAGIGHYGSTVWDEMNGSMTLTINVCDKCLVEHKDRVAVMETLQRETETTLKPWKGPWTGDDDG